MNYCSFSFHLPIAKSLILAFLFLLTATILPAQEKTLQKDTDDRLLNFGFKAGLAHLMSYPRENPTGQYLSDRHFFNYASHMYAVDAQLYRPNGIGAGLELGYRQQVGSFSALPGSQLFNGQTKGEFPHASLFVNSSLLYHRILGERWVFMGNVGGEFHHGLSPGGQEYSYYDGRENYLFTTRPFFINLGAGAEVRVLLQDALWLGFFLQGIYGLGQTAELFYLPEENNEQISLGEYRGTGFDFGLRISYCFSCH